MSQYRSSIRWLLLSILVWATAACQTAEDRTASVNTWSLTPIDRRPDDRSHSGSRRTTRVDDTGRANATYLEGTGRFTGEQPSSRQIITQAGDDGVTLNLVNVPTAQAAKTILGDILGVQYTVAPALDGKITIQTPKPVTRSAMIELFQHALRANGATILNSNDIYKIVPADQASIGTRIQIGDTPGSTDKLASGLRIVQLKYVAASEIRNILEPISPRGSLVRADDARNTLTLSGNASDIAGILEAIAVFDVDVMKGMSFALVPVKTSQPTAIADELKKIFASGREGPSMVQFIPNKRLNSILIISAQPQYLSRAEGWVRRLDAHAEGNEKQFFTYRVQNRRAQELVDVLQSIFSNELGSSGRTTRTPRNVTPRYQEATVQSATPRSSTSRQFGSSAGQFSQMGGGQDGSSTFQSPPSSDPPMGAADTNGSSPMDNGQDPPRIKVATDEAKNAILIEATPSDYRRVMRVVETLDVMPNQVLIEATIAEVSLTDEIKFGLRWLLKGKNADYTFSDSVAGAVSSVFPGFSYALKMANITATLNALSEVTDVNVISSPSLTVMDNKVAVLQIGDQVPIVTQTATSVLAPGAPVVNSVSYRDTGVILSITPRINDSGRVLLDIEQEVSSVAPTSTSGIDSPTIRQRRVKTTVMVSDGEVLVLGGLMQKSDTISRTQVPIFGDIPVIGNAFKQKDNRIGKTELIILLAPHVMRDVYEARQVTEEFRKGMARYSSRSRKQHRSIENTVRRTFE